MKIIRLFLLFMLLSFPFSFAAAQDLIAMHPYHGPEEADEISALFFNMSVREVPRIGDNKYASFAIDLDNLPPDVPEGGFPPWICPMPSITGDAGYAITGEVAPDPDWPGAFRVRLYLWKMEGTRMLGSDEMTVAGPEDLGILPLFLQWILSWIDEDKLMEEMLARLRAELLLAEQPSVMNFLGQTVVMLAEQAPPEPHWLYVGLRGGGGYSRLSYIDNTNDPEYHPGPLTFNSINFAVQVSTRLARYFELQTELNFMWDFGQDGISDTDERYTSMNMHIPLIAKFVLQSNRLKAAAYGGFYLHVPMYQSGNDIAVKEYEYSGDFPGFVFGMSIGWKWGRGNLFLDGRYEYDALMYNSTNRGVSTRNGIRVNIGYELGFFQKNR